MKALMRHVTGGILFALSVAAATLVAPAAGQTQPPAAPTLDAVRLSLYDYDPALPLRAKVTPMPPDPGKTGALRARFHVVYDSVHDQRVTAIFTRPRRFAPPYPAVVLLAGSGGNKDTDYVRIVADLMSSLGYATISIDAQYHGERARPNRSGDFHLLYNPTNRDAWIQTVVDLRRAVDFLASRPDIQKDRIGFLGFSQGGMVGATFIGVEPRIRAACLVVAGAGFAEWAKQSTLVKPEQIAPLELAAAIADPIYFVGRFRGPILMLSAKRDELIPKSATDALFAATGGRAEIKWYDASHSSPAALVGLIPDVRTFMVKYLGVRKPTG